MKKAKAIIYNFFRYIIFTGVICVLLQTCTDGAQLSDGIYSFSVSGTSGALIDGQLLSPSIDFFGACFDNYEWESISQSGTSDESQDSVVSSSQIEDTNTIKLTLQCTNPVLSTKSISLEKVYILRKGTGKLLKRVTFINNGGGTYLITWKANVKLNYSFRDTGIYYIPQGTIGLPASSYGFGDVVISNQYYGGNKNVAAIVINPSLGYGCGSYLFESEGNFSSAFTIQGDDDDMTTYFNRDGWKFTIHKGFLRYAVNTSAGMQYDIFAGRDQTDFITQYLALPEVQAPAAGFASAPDWIDKVKASQFMTPGPAGYVDAAYRKQMMAILNLLGEGYLMPVQGPYNSQMGWFPVAGYAYFEETSKYFDEMEQCSPQIKEGVYTFQCSRETAGIPSDYTYPQWWTMNKDGTPYAFGWGTTGYLQAVYIPECRQNYIDNVPAMIRDINAGFLYIDGGTAPFGIVVRKPNWKTGSEGVDTFNDWNQMYSTEAANIRTVAGPNVAVFCNMPAAYYADCSLLELNHMTSGEWKLRSEALYATKLAQRGSAWIALLSWNKQTDTQYVNHLFAYAMKPNLEWRYNAAYPLTDFNFLEQHVPYINGVYEIRHARIVDANVTPWWRTDNSNWEALALFQGSSGLVPVINHTGTTQGITVGADTAPMGLDGNKPIFVWKELLSDPNTLPTNQQYIIESNTLELINGAGPRISFNTGSFPNERLLMCTLTNAPGWVYSVDGRHTQMRLSDTLEVSLTGSWSDSSKQLSLTVQSQRWQCEVLVYWPTGWDAIPLYVDGKLLNNKQYVNEGGGRFLLIGLEGMGTHNIGTSVGYYNYSFFTGPSSRDYVADLNCVADAYGYSGSPGTNYGTGSIYIGAGPAGSLDAYLCFENPSGKIPPCAQIKVANLCLYYSSQGGPNESNVSAYQALRSWSETTSSWNNASTGQPWGLGGARQDGVDRQSPALNVRRLIDAGLGYRYFCWDITSAVQQWLSTSSSNFGLIMQAVSDSTPYRIFSSRTASSQYVPFIEVDYSIETPKQDINRDGVVDYLDLSILAEQWLLSGTGLEGDIWPSQQSDGTVNFEDFTVFTQKWLKTEPCY